MSFQNFSKDFAKQFRDECELYSHAGEYQYGKMLVKIVKGNHWDMSFTGKKLTEQFFNTSLIAHILHTLRNDNLSAARELIKNIQAIGSQFETYIKEEPYTAQYYNDRIAMLNSFSELIDAFYNDFEVQVYSQLNNYLKNIAGPAECPVAESSSLTELVVLAEFYLKNILSYYNYFLVTCQLEENNSKGVQLTTYMADHLQHLIVYIEELIAGIEDTRLMLLNWEEKMAIMEEQELYN